MPMSMIENFGGMPWWVPIAKMGLMVTIMGGPRWWLLWVWEKDIFCKKILQFVVIKNHHNDLIFFFIYGGFNSYKLYFKI